MIYSEPVSVRESLQLDLDDAHVHMHVGGAFLFESGPLRQEGGIDIDRLRSFVESRLHRTPRCRQCLTRTPITGRPVWIDDASFNIGYHVRHTHLPHPGDERQMKRLCGHIASQRLDRERPLWELHVVEGLEADRFALVIKLHQCITGGLWRIGLIESLLSSTPEKDFDPGPVWLPRPASDLAGLLRADLRRRLGTPLRAGYELLRAGRESGELRDEVERTIAGFRGALPASETPFNQPIGPHRRFDWLTTDKQRALDVVRRHDTSLEAVVLAALAGAVGRFLIQRGITPPEQRDLSFRAALPEQPGGLCVEGEAGDTLSWIVSSLPIDEEDPVRRLELTREALGDAAHVSYRLFAAASEWLWPGLFGALARRQLASRASNLTATSLRGPETARYLLGSRLLEAYPLLPLVPDQALRLALYSYTDRIHWGFNSDWDLLPDLHDLVEATETAFAELCEASEKAEK